MKLNQRGIAHLLVIALVLLGLASSVYLVKSGSNFNPQAEVAMPVEHSQETSFILSVGKNIVPIMYRSEDSNQKKDKPANISRGNSGGNLAGPQSETGNETTGERAGEIIGSPSGQTWYYPGQEFALQVLVRSDYGATNTFNAHLTFPTDLVEIVRVEPSNKNNDRYCKEIVEACQNVPVNCDREGGCPSQQVCEKMPSCKIPPGWYVRNDSACVAAARKQLYGRSYHPTQVVVGFNKGVTIDQVESLVVKELGLKYKVLGDNFENFRYIVVETQVNVKRQSDTIAETICKFKSRDIVSSAEANYTAYTSSGGTDSTSTAEGSVSGSQVNENAGSGTSDEAMLRAKRSKPVLSSFISSWYAQNYDNNYGFANFDGVSEAGLYTIKQQPARMLTITFRTKKVGQGKIYINDTSSIRRTGSDENLLTNKNSVVYVNVQTNSGGGHCDLAVPACKPGEKLVPEPQNYDHTKELNAQYYCPRYKCVPESPENCPMTQKYCQYGTIITGYTDAGCPIEQCQPTPEPSVPVNCPMTNVYCPYGSTITGYNEVGCPIEKCNERPDEECKPAPTCAPNEELRINPASTGCAQYECVSQEKRKCTSVAECAEGQTLINNGLDQNGCISYSCVYVGNEQVAGCDRSSAVVYGGADENGRGVIVCKQKSKKGEWYTETSYSVGDFNKDGKINLQDLAYFFTTQYWSSH